MIPRDERWKGILILILVVAGIAAIIWRPLNLGLDLKGGTTILLQAEQKDGELSADTMERLAGVMERRVNQLGLSESTVQRVGTNRLNIELPGFRDADAAVESLGRTAQLTFSDADGNVIVTGAELKDAQYSRDQINRPAVSITFNDAGAKAFADFTRKNVGRVIDIKLDQEVIQRATIEEPITDGKGQIAGSFTAQKAMETAALLRAGALPVPVSVVEYRSVGPTLGQSSIDYSLRAAIIGLIGTFLFMLVIYHGLGLVAALALVIYAALVTGTLMGLGAVLTLPGIAGLILSIGMAVDGNVLVFERAKEEFKNTNSPVTALRKGFERAFTAIFDSNATTFLSAMILYILAVGTVKGFAITLGLGVLVSFITAVTASRIMAYILLSTPLGKNPKLMGLTTIFKPRKFNIIGWRNVWFTFSGAILVAGLVSLFAQGLNFGLDFAGGSVLGVQVNKTLTADEIEQYTSAAGLESVSILPGKTDFTLKAKELPKANVTTLLTELEAAQLQPEVVRQEFVGPTIGREVRDKAILAVIIALLGQIIYVSIRFEWRFAVAAVLALFHDVLILVGLFSLLQREIDGTFLAALLTVVGYSINDTVVIFDRIRENRKHSHDEKFGDLVNRSVNETMARSLNTGASVMFMLLMLLLFGGATLNNFALALLVGVVLGTYSSIFNASPIVAIWHGLDKKTGRHR